MARSRARRICNGYDGEHKGTCRNQAPQGAEESRARHGSAALDSPVPCGTDLRMIGHLFVGERDLRIVSLTTTNTFVYIFYRIFLMLWGVNCNLSVQVEVCGD
jgi:hypothetical protein